MINRLMASLALALTLTSGAAHAEGDAVSGRDLAERWCVQCHNIERGGPFKLHPPSLASIAVFRSEEQIYTRIITPPIHSAMPQMGAVLTREVVEDLMAYIVSLERK